MALLIPETDQATTTVSPPKTYAEITILLLCAQEALQKFVAKDRTEWWWERSSLGAPNSRVEEWLQNRGTDVSLLARKPTGYVLYLSAEEADYLREKALEEKEALKALSIDDLISTMPAQEAPKNPRPVVNFEEIWRKTLKGPR